MEQIVLVIHVLAAIGIIGLILIQQGKGADMGASFGSGASQTLFGPSGSGNALTRATGILATVFFVTSLGLAYIAKHRVADTDIIVDDLPALVESRGVAPVPQLNDEIPADMDIDLPAAPGDVSDIPE